MSTIVKEFYETHAYPNYPLWFRPRWQEGYLASSLFCARLAYQKTGVSSPLFLQKSKRHVLVAGSGEILPYIIRKLEPKHHIVSALDLSERSLKRARLRLSTSFKSVNFLCEDLQAFLHKQQESFTHIDLFGVLHHMPNPEEVIPLLRDALEDGGHMRIMIYNSISRAWIHEWQDIFQSKKLNFRKNSDLDCAREMLKESADSNLILREKLNMMGPSLLNNNARFADTFMHVLEQRIPPIVWFDWFEQNNLEVVGLFDRYGEMDDLENPWLHVPNPKTLEKKARSGEWFGNIEVYLQKKSEPKNPEHTHLLGAEAWLWKLKGFPSLWKSYADSNELGLLECQKAWVRMIDGLDNPFQCKTSYENERLNRLII